NVQLHLLAPHQSSPADPGIQSPGSGVVPGARAVRPRAASWKSWLAMLAGCVSLFGQGERCVVNPLLRSPGTALAVYWESLELNDAEELQACTLVTEGTLPYPGMLWAFPATRGLWIRDLRYMPVDEDEVVVAYDVNFT